MNNKDIWDMGFMLIGIILIFFAGFYFHAVSQDFDGECSKCITQECMDYDVVCGDFGQYYLKFGMLVAIGLFGCLIVYKKSFLEDSK